MSGLEALFNERRRFSRHHATTKVQVRRDGKAKFCRCVDLSAMGVGVTTTDMDLKVGNYVELNFAIELGELVKIHKRAAEVIHVTSGVTGFKMLPLRSHAAEVI